MADYDLPDDLAVLSDDELEAALTTAVRTFRSESATTTVTASTLPRLRGLKADIERIKAEKQERLTAAEAAAAEIDALNAEIFGEPEAETEAVETETVETETETEAIEPTAVVTASGRRSINLAALRGKQAGTNTGMSQYLPADNPTGVEIFASVDVPGYRPGQEFQLSDVTEGMMRRATGLKTAGGGTGLVASYTLPFPEDLIVKDGSSAPEGSVVSLRAADQHRLKGDNLVASGGWCAPSETVYDLVNIACPEMLWDLPEIQLNRGGLRYFQAPILDVAALTWVHTEQDDIAGNPKPCFTIPCPSPLEVRAEAEGVCLQVGILTQRFFPELVDLYVRQSVVAHEIRLKTRAYDLARLASTQVTTTASFAAFSAVYAAVALQAADMIERYNLCDSYALEVVFPFWARNMFLADIARQRGVSPADLNPAIIQQAFDSLGVRVQWARGLTPDVPTNIGNATPAVAWPADLNFLIYPSGNWQLGRGPEVNLGVIIDSTLATQNNERMFSEEAVALINRLGISRNVTVTVCPNGAIGPEAAAVCPIA